MFIVGERVWHEKTSCASSTEAELLAIKMALEHLQKNKLKGVVVISDCQSVVETINKQVKGKKIYQLYGPAIIEIQKLLKQTNSSLLWNPKKESLIPDIACRNEQSSQYKTISLPKLDKLNPTIESTCIKLSEEVGELSRLVGWCYRNFCPNVYKNDALEKGLYRDNNKYNKPTINHCRICCRV